MDLNMTRSTTVIRYSVVQGKAGSTLRNDIFFRKVAQPGALTNSRPRQVSARCPKVQCTFATVATAPSRQPSPPVLNTACIAPTPSCFCSLNQVLFINIFLNISSSRHVKSAPMLKSFRCGRKIQRIIKAFRALGLNGLRARVFSLVGKTAFFEARKGQAVRL